jgi:hypothetical protein
MATRAAAKGDRLHRKSKGSPRKRSPFPSVSTQRLKKFPSHFRFGGAGFFEKRSGLSFTRLKRLPDMPNRSRIMRCAKSRIQICGGQRILKRQGKREVNMKLKETVPITGAAGYILLWLLGIPIPILLLIFLLRGCS